VDPEPPWTDCYLKHEELPPTKWWDTARGGLRDDFRPDKDHAFDQDDIHELANTATKEEKAAEKWPVILQAAIIMKTNVRIMPCGIMDHPYSDQ
jgi:hypothetical protein